MRGRTALPTGAMTIKPGDRLPDATLYESLEFGEACPLAPAKVSVAEASKGKKIVIFGLPGAYTPTCSAQHVPGYVKELAALKATGHTIMEDEHAGLIDLGDRVACVEFRTKANIASLGALAFIGEAIERAGDE